MKNTTVAEKDAMQNLVVAVNDFSDFSKKFSECSSSTLQTIYHIHKLCAAIAECESLGISEDLIRNTVLPVRHIHASSPFFQRIQKWPRGYAGDFETIELICNSVVTAPIASIGYHLEWFALNSGIAQQHRNKVTIQANYIVDTILQNNEANILIIGGGSGRDIQAILPFLEKAKAKFVINDIDISAITFMREIIQDKLNVEFFHNNVIKIMKDTDYKHRKFDLILFGGVFDYLTDKVISQLLKHMHTNMQSDNSKIIFTNIKTGNPYRVWIEYLADWHLIERSQADCMAVCTQAGISPECVKMFTDSSGLTLITEVKKCFQ